MAVAVLAQAAAASYSKPRAGLCRTGGTPDVHREKAEPKICAKYCQVHYSPVITLSACYISGGTLAVIRFKAMQVTTSVLSQNGTIKMQGQHAEPWGAAGAKPTRKNARLKGRATHATGAEPTHKRASFTQAKPQDAASVDLECKAAQIGRMQLANKVLTKYLLHVRIVDWSTLSLKSTTWRHTWSPVN